MNHAAIDKRSTVDVQNGSRCILNAHYTTSTLVEGGTCMTGPDDFAVEVFTTGAYEAFEAILRVNRKGQFCEMDLKWDGEWTNLVRGS
ncbi:hypothetical protein BPOR_0981g00040 [Botrytis porri]|uniref:Uncharacterized protein n=1 Tax=Botrytis porri TaxID=87229 RepID=A0A4Z1KEG0_9HELO|nr:hypothetical protein BPOR_0981g00040 [Botrytis porri]